MRRQSCQTKSNKQKFSLNQTYETDDVFEMDLLSSSLEEQIYRKNDANLMYLSIKLPDGKIVSGHDVAMAQGIICTPIIQPSPSFRIRSCDL